VHRDFEAAPHKKGASIDHVVVGPELATRTPLCFRDRVVA
jgi:hypothetical protein